MRASLSFALTLICGELWRNWMALTLMAGRFVWLKISHEDDAPTLGVAPGLVAVVAHAAGVAVAAVPVAIQDLAQGPALAVTVPAPGQAAGLVPSQDTSLAPNLHPASLALATANLIPALAPARTNHAVGQLVASLAPAPMIASPAPRALLR